MRVITPYISWTLENGLAFISLGDERKRLEKEQYVHEQHLAAVSYTHLDVYKRQVYDVSGLKNTKVHHHDIVIPADAAPGDYHLKMCIRDSVGGLWFRI